MVPFLLITALINIGLGVWLANYLGLAWNRPNDRRADRQDDYRGRRDDYAAPLEFSDCGRGEVGDSERTPTYGNYDDEPLPSSRQEVAPQEDIDGDLLAGIEQFRNQLAQLKNRVDITTPVDGAPTEGSPAAAR